MNLDELQSVQARERQSSDLQHLRSSFYREVGEFIQGLDDRRQEVVDRADDPFSSPEVRQISDDIETAEQTVEAIYERRVGKVVKKASIAAAGMPVDDDGLTEEEEALFEDLVARIEGNRETVLAVLDGETPDLSGSVDADVDASNDGPAPSDTDPETSSGNREPGVDADADPASTRDTDGVSAADLMGSGSGEDRAADGNSAQAEESTPDQETTSAGPDDDPLAADPDDSPTEVPPEPGPPGTAEPDEDRSTTHDASSGGTDRTADERPASASSDRDVPGVPRTTVRITADVGEVVGADDRDYDLGPEDVVTLPAPNADVLLEKDAAERLE